MKKILIGLVAAIVIATVGFFGFEFYVQRRVAGEVEAAFDQIRATGGKASHGKVSFDLSSRTITVADITGETAAQPPASVKIASFTASGVSQPDAMRFSAANIEATDIELGVSMAAQPGLSVSYKVPRITIKDYSGPAGLQRPPVSSSLIDVYRFAIEQFAAITASSVTAPSLAGTIKFGAAMPGGGEVAYSGLAMQDIKDGKIASVKVDGFAFTVNTQQAGKADKLTGNLANVASYDIDLSAAAAMFDPQKANDDRYYRAYRQISAGPYTITSRQGLNMRIDSLTIDDVGLRPSRIQLPALMAMIPAAGTVPTPAQARDMIEKAAGIYEGIRIGNAEMRGLSMETPQAHSRSRRCGSAWKTARSANLHSKAWIRVLRRGPSRSDALRSNPSTSPNSCECRRCSPTRRKRPHLTRHCSCCHCSKVSSSRASSRLIRTATSRSTSIPSA